MASLDSILTKQKLGGRTATRFLDDECVAIRIRQTGGAAVTSVTVTTATNIVLIDADGTTTSTFADDTTIGAVADTINAADNWECKVLDGLRADASANTLVNGVIAATTVDGYSVYDALTDTSVLKALTIRCTYDRNVGVNSPANLHRVELIEGMYQANVSGVEAGAVRVYDCDSHGNGTDETLIYAITSVDATDTTVQFASGNASIHSGWGNDLVFRVMDTTSITDDGSNFIQALYRKE